MAALRFAAAARNLARGLKVYADRLNPLERFTDGELWERVRFDRRGLQYDTDLLLQDLLLPYKRGQPAPSILQAHLPGVGVK